MQRLRRCPCVYADMHLQKLLAAYETFHPMKDKQRRKRKSFVADEGLGEAESLEISVRSWRRRAIIRRLSPPDENACSGDGSSMRDGACCKVPILVPLQVFLLRPFFLRRFQQVLMERLSAIGCLDTCIFLCFSSAFSAAQFVPALSISVGLPCT